MKIRNVLAFLLVLLMASSAWAAGTVVVTSDFSYAGISGAKETRQIVYTVTFGADASSPTAVALDNILKSGVRIPTVAGWWLLEVSTLFGATAPTDNSDLYLYRAIGTNKVDVLGGNGENKIDNATNNTFTPATTTRPLLGTELLSMSNNAVNNATFTLVLWLYR